MIKRGFGIILIFILLFSIMFVSAGWFSDLFKGNKITGNAVELGEVIIENPKDFAGNGILVSEYYYGSNYTQYAGRYCEVVQGCTGFKDVVVKDDAVKACRCDSYWGCEGRSCVNSVASSYAWERVGSVTCTGCPVEETCADTDGGKNYYVKGTAKDDEGSFEDYCLQDGKILREHYCEAGIYQVESYACPNGCVDGACVFEEEVVCGNGIIEVREDCDGNNLNGKTCLDFDYNSGTLSCKDDCTFDFSNCKSEIQLGECVFENPKDFAGNGILVSEYYYGDDFTQYAGRYCEVVQGCTGFKDVVVKDDAVKACRCDSYWGCEGQSCVNKVSSSSYWERVGSVTCTGCPEGTCEELEYIKLNSIKIDLISDVVSINYSKNFDTCAHLLNTSFKLVHSQNYFCEKGDNILITQAISNVNVVAGLNYKLCHGNNYNFCSGLVFPDLIESLDVVLSVATLKDNYLVREQINLTDPPENSDTSLGIARDVVMLENEGVYSNFYLSKENSFSYSGKTGSDFLYIQGDDSVNKEFDGYIVQFEKDPMVVEKKRLDKTARANEKYVQERAFYNPVKIYKQLFSIMPKDVGRKVDDYSESLENENEKIKSQIMDLEKSGKITGNTISEEHSLKIENEFKNVFNGIYLNVSEEDAKEIKKVRGVKNIYPNYKVNMTLMDSVSLINADDVWQLDEDGNDCIVSGKDCLTGKGIDIAIIDTGVDYTHEDLGGCYGEGCKVIGGYDFVNNDADPMDDHGHGTHCAATAVGNGILKGVALDSKIYAFKVLDEGGSGYSDVIIAAIERSIDLDNDGIIMEDENDYVDIISMSLGGWGTPDDPMSQAVDNVVNAGIVAVIAAGNSGPGEQTIGSPGTARKAITVAASDKNDVIADFSSRGPVVWMDSEENEKAMIKPDITAPGVDICAAQWENAFNDDDCFGDGEHVAISGTSMATPHIAGAVALLKQKNPDWTPEEIKNSLRNTAVDIGENVLTQGLGRVDVLEVVNSEKPLIASLNEMEYHPSGKIDITGTAKGNNFEKYEVYYSIKNSEEWNLICEGFEEVDEGVLCEGFNTDSLIDGKYYIKLVVESISGEKSEDYGFFEIDNVKILNPLNNDIYRAGDLINISIELLNSAYILYSAECIDLETGTVFSSGLNIKDNSFVEWNTSGLKKGFYNLRLGFEFEGDTFIEEISEIYLDLDLKEGWPVRINWDSETFEGESNLLTTSKSYSFVQNLKSQTREIGEGAFSTFSTKDLFFQELSEFGILSGENFYYWAGMLEPIVSDLDKDGKKEIMVGKGGNPPQILVYDDEGNLLFLIDVGNAPAAGGNFPLPLVGDLNNDGFEEIITFNYRKDLVSEEEPFSELFAFNYKGSLLWKTPVPMDFHPTIIIADLDLDGNKEIIIKGNDMWDVSSENKSDSEKMTIVNNEGEIISSWYLEDVSWGADIVSSPAVGNFDNDDDFEIVVASPANGAGGVWENGQFQGWNNKGVIYIYNMDGTIVQGWPIYTEGVIFSSPVVGDINNNGEEEIVVGLMYASDIFPDEKYGGVYVFDRKGEVLSGWPVAKGYNFQSSPSLGDVDNDKNLEISISRLGFSTYLFNADGTIVKGWLQYTSWNDYYSTIMGDVNADGKTDILTTAGEGVYAWNSDGSLINGFPKVTEVDAQAPAVISDIDNDGKLELIASSDYDMDKFKGDFKHRGSIYVWDLDAPYNESTMEWPMFMHDPQHTGNYNFERELMTRPQSKITNNENKEINGILVMKLQKKIGNEFIDEKIVTNQSVIIPANSLIKLDVGGNYGWNLKDVAADEAREYRVYASFEFEEQKIEDSWEFNVR